MRYIYLSLFINIVLGCSSPSETVGHFLEEKKHFGDTININDTLLIAYSETSYIIIDPKGGEDTINYFNYSDYLETTHCRCNTDYCTAKRIADNFCLNCHYNNAPKGAIETKIKNKFDSVSINSFLAFSNSLQHYYEPNMKISEHFFLRKNDHEEFFFLNEKSQILLWEYIAHKDKQRSDSCLIIIN